MLKQKTGKVRKLARGNVNQMMTAKMKENFAFVMVPVACLVSDLKENVLNYLTLLMDKFILQEGSFFIERNTLTIYSYIFYISKIDLVKTYKIFILDISMIEQCIRAIILIKSLVWTRSLVTLMGNGTEFNRRAKKQHLVLNQDIIAGYHQKCQMQNITVQKNK